MINTILGSYIGGRKYFFLSKNSATGILELREWDNPHYGRIQQELGQKDLLRYNYFLNNTTDE
jgi:hypothetical protein